MYPLVVQNDQVMLTFQPDKRFRTILRLEVPADPLVAIKWVRIPGEPGHNPAILTLLREDTPPTYYASGSSLTSHAHHCDRVRHERGNRRITKEAMFRGMHPKEHQPEHPQNTSIPGPPPPGWTIINDDEQYR